MIEVRDLSETLWRQARRRPPVVDGFAGKGEGIPRAERAGTSTTMRLLLGLGQLDPGYASIAGHVLGAAAVALLRDRR